jgi:hypothetical protein
MRPRVALPAALLMLATLSACGPGTPSAGDTESSKPTESVTPSAEPTTEPDPEPAPVVLTCESIVSPATISGFDSQGIEITPEADFAAKLATEGNALKEFFDVGGLLCQTGKGAGAYEIYGYGVFSESQFAPVRAQFVADGYLEVFGDIGMGYEVPEDQEGLPRYCYHRVGEFTVCGNGAPRVEEIMAVLGLD